MKIEWKLVDRDKLYRLYWIDNLSIRKIAKLYEVVMMSVKQKMVKYEIARRSKSLAALLRPPGRKHTEASLAKMSLLHSGSKNAFYGKTHTQETKDIISAAMKGQRKGEKNHNWKPFNEHKKPFSKGLRDIIEYKNWRKDVFAHDGWKCQICGVLGGKLQVDHVKPFGLILHENNIKTIEEAILCVELWDIENGRTLCENCHKSTATFGAHTKKLIIGSENK